MNVPPRTALIVDDDPSIDALAKAFGRRGWLAKVAATAAEGIALLDSGFVPDAVVLDLSLPDQDGNAVFEKVRELGLQARVAILTGTTFPSLLMRAQEMKPDLFIVKPIRAESLVNLFADFEIGEAG